MDSWFKSKWFVRIVSLAFAVSLYVFVNINEVDPSNDSRIPSGSDETQVIEDVPLDIRIDAERFVVSGVPEVVAVTMEGSNSALTPTVRKRNFNVYVDLEDLGAGEHTVEIEYSNIPKELFVYIEPKTIDVTIEERSSKEFTVNVDLINEDQLPEGYELGEPKVNPGKVTIVSSKSIIDQVAMVKVFVDVAGLTESINNREVPINVYDGQGNELKVRVEPDTAVVSVEVDNPSKVVPMKVSTSGELPEGYELISITANVDEVEVFAISETLQGIEEITTEKIDLSTIKESGKIKVPLALPDGAIVPGDPVEVTIVIEQTKTIKDVSIDVESPDGQSVSFLEPSEPVVMSVTVVGDEKDVKEITAEDLRIFINTNGLNEGEHKVPVSIEGPDNVTFTSEIEQVTIAVE